MTFFTGPAAVLGEPMYKGQVLAAEEINAQGGLLGKRKNDVQKADEAAGVDGNVKELRRLKLQEKIDFFCGITSSGNTPALGPVAEELKVLTIFVDGCTDFLFDKAVPNPHYIFRITNIQSADGATAALAVAQTWPDVKKIAHIHPDYSYGRNAFDHFKVIMSKIMPKAEVVSEGWPKLGTTDFSSHITKAIAAKPDLCFSSVWGGDYVAMYKQALQYGMFDKMKFATTLALGVAPHAIGKDHPEGVIAGCHANYYFTVPKGDLWPPNKSFVEKYHARWKEYPNFQAEGAYTATDMLKLAVEKANNLMGGWPDDDAIISQLEGMGYAGPAGYVYIRPDNHQGYKDTLIGFSKNVPEYPFPILDPDRLIVIPIRNITAPPGWPKGEPTSTYTWIEKTWPTVKA
jgi:branched-chain amino acid transport system substrate-binding protein